LTFPIIYAIISLIIKKGEIMAEKNDECKYKLLYENLSKRISDLHYYAHQMDPGSIKPIFGISDSEFERVRRMSQTLKQIAYGNYKRPISKFKP